MDGAIRDAAVKTFGHLPMIGVFVATAAVALWFAYATKDDDNPLWKVAGCIVGGVSLLFAVAGYSTAKSICSDLYTSNLRAFYDDNCPAIVSCTTTFYSRESSCA